MTPETPAKVTATTLPDEPEKVLGAERLEKTRANAEFWFNAGNKEPDHDRAILYVANAMFAWRNAAYGLSTLLTIAIAERDALLQSFNAERLRAEAAEAENVRLNGLYLSANGWTPLTQF